MQQSVAFSAVSRGLILAIVTAAVLVSPGSVIGQDEPKKATSVKTSEPSPARNVKTTTSRTSPRVSPRPSTKSRVTPASRPSTSSGLRDGARSRTSTSSSSKVSRSGAGAAKKWPVGTGAPGQEAKATDKGEEVSEEKAAKEPEGFVAKARAFVKDNSTVLISTLSVGLVGVLSWLFLASRRSKRKSEGFLEPLDDELEAAAPVEEGKRFSSTRIRASDVSARLSGKEQLTSETVETDQEYAFVVDEDALGRTEVDMNTGRAYARDGEIRRHLDAHDYGAAYAAYDAIVRADGEVEFRKDVESALGEHLIRSKDLQKAANVLEHHVATHAPEEVDPETFFSLGYIHFQTKEVERSKKYFELFVSRDKRPEYVERARKILEHLGGGVSRN